MNKIIFFVVLFAFILGISIVPAYSQDRDMERKYYTYKSSESGSYRSYRGSGRGEAFIIDTLVTRPIGLATCVVGFAAFIVASPFAIMTGTNEQAVDAFLREPGDYTFKRPLGQFD